MYLSVNVYFWMFMFIEYIYVWVVFFKWHDLKNLSNKNNGTIKLRDWNRCLHSYFLLKTPCLYIKENDSFIFSYHLTSSWILVQDHGSTLWWLSFIQTIGTLMMYNRLKLEWMNSIFREWLWTIFQIKW